MIVRGGVMVMVIVFEIIMRVWIGGGGGKEWCWSVDMLVKCRSLGVFVVRCICDVVVTAGCVSGGGMLVALTMQRSESCVLGLAGVEWGILMCRWCVFMCWLSGATMMAWQRWCH